MKLIELKNAYPEIIFLDQVPMDLNIDNLVFSKNLSNDQLFKLQGPTIVLMDFDDLKYKINYLNPNIIVGLKINKPIGLEDNLVKKLKDLNLNILIIPKTYSLEEFALGILERLSLEKSLIIKENKLKNNLFINMDINTSTIRDYVLALGKSINREVMYYGKLDSKIFASGHIFFPDLDIDHIKNLDREKYYMEEIQHNAQVYGYLIVDLGPYKLDDNSRSLISYVANMVLAKIQNQIALEDSKEMDKIDLIADLCMNNVKTEEEVQFRASLQGWSIKSGLLAVIFDIDDFKASLIHSNKRVEELEEEKQVIFKLVIKEMSKINYNSYYYSKSDSIIFLVNVSLDDNLTDLDNFIESNIKPIHNFLNNKDLNFTLTIGVGTYYSNIMETYKSYNEAVEAINISRIFKEVDDLCCYKDVMIFKYLMEVMTQKDYHSIYTDLVKAIIETDRVNNTEYFITLKELIKNNWNLKETSRVLFIHYNTIIYRFEKLKELLGMNLEDFYERLILTLTVMILEVEKHIDFNKGLFKK